MKITKPTLLLDKKRCLANIEKLVHKAERNQLNLRPHFKTHQAHEVGAWFRDFGIKKIATSSLSMAHYFAQDGWEDILVAFPTNILEIDTINELANSIRLGLLVQSIEVLDFLKTALKHPVDAYIEIDLGYGRTGIQSTDTATLDSLIDAMQGSHLTFKGFIGHAGHSYNAKGFDAIKAVHNEALSHVANVYKHYHNNHPNLEISIGDTPTCSTMSGFGYATELRPGNFVFYDLVQTHIGSCNINEIAVAVACPIVAMHPERHEVILYGGGVHFSKDVYHDDTYGKCYGIAVADDGNSWSTPIPNTYLRSISQEHGVLKCNPEFFEHYKIGDVVKILPVHSCMTADLLKVIYTTDEQKITMMSTH